MKNQETNKACPECGKPIPTDAPQGICPQCALAGASTQAADAGASLVPEDYPTVEAIKSAFPQYEILQVLGYGAMGIVYKARQSSLDRLVALKILPKKLSADPHFAERFSREGQLLARLNHPNIVSVYDFGQVDDFYFLSLEYVDGVNLREAMRAGRFSPKEALALVPKICEALQFAHDQEILHRDIKPENILLDTRGQVKIADFGIAKMTGDSKNPSPTLTGTGQTLGTPHYMAPEQIENPASVDHRADIYSLGVVFYEMLTGELPLGRFEVPSGKSEVDAHIDEIVLRALEKDRERRQATADTLKTEIQSAKVNPTNEKQPPVPATETNWSYKALFSAILAGATFLLLGLAFLLLVIQTDVTSNNRIVMLTPGFPGVLCGLIASVLGWMALTEIRAQSGRLLGLPLAIFGALTLPVFVVIGFTLMIPWLLSVQTQGSFQLSPFGWGCLFLLTTGIIALMFSATVRYGANNRDRFTVSRNMKIGIAVTGLLILFLLFPMNQYRATFPVAESPAPIVSVQRVGNLNTTDLDFLSCSGGIWNNGGQITLAYAERQSGIEASWGFEGQFTEFDAQIRNLVPTDNLATKRGYDHRNVSITLPSDLPNQTGRQILDSIERQWIHRTLSLNPGEVVPIFSVTESNGNVVTITVEGRRRPN